MMKEGTYSAWFKTPNGQGTGIVQLAAGKIWGSDTVLSYAGSYEANGDRFTAVIKTRRHAPGQPSLFGPDDLTINLEGSCKGTPLTCRGFAAEAPDVPFEALLLLSVSDDAEPAPSPRRAQKLDADRLPKPIWR